MSCCGNVAHTSRNRKKSIDTAPLVRLAHGLINSSNTRTDLHLSRTGFVYVTFYIYGAKNNQKSTAQNVFICLLLILVA